MEIKFELDTKRASKAAVAIATTYTLSGVSLATDSPQLAGANTLATIIVIAILYGPRPGL
jgi:hypothetical protein